MRKIIKQGLRTQKTEKETRSKLFILIVYTFEVQFLTINKYKYSRSQRIINDWGLVLHLFIFL